MRICPNEGCAHRARFKSVAEFRDDVETCATCGTRLVPAPPMAAAPSRHGPPWGRVVVSVGAVALLVALEQVLLPGVNAEALTSQTGLFALFALVDAPGLSVVALGHTPMHTGFLLVELVALLVPWWRPLLNSGREARRKLLFPALLTALACACLQASSMATYLSSLAGDSAIVLDDVEPRRIVGLLVAGAALATALAFLAGARGIANMFALVYVAGTLRTLVQRFSAAAALPEDVQPSPLAYVVPPAMILGVTWWLLRKPRPGALPGAEGYGSSGAVVASLMIASSVLVLPASLLPIFGGEGKAWSDALYSSEYLYTALYLGLALLTTLGLSFWMLPRARLAAFLVTLNPSGNRAICDGAARAARRAHLGRGLVAVAVLVLVSPVARAVGDEIWQSVGAAGLVGAVAVALDIVDEWRMRAKHGALVNVWPLHQLVALGPAVEALRRAEIPVLARSWRLRSLVQALAPAIPVELCVPAAHAARAEDLLRGLLVPVPAPAAAPVPAPA